MVNDWHALIIFARQAFGVLIPARVTCLTVGVCCDAHNPSLTSAPSLTKTCDMMMPIVNALTLSKTPILAQNVHSSSASHLHAPLANDTQILAPQAFGVLELAQAL